MAFYDITIPARPLKCLILSTFHEKEDFSNQEQNFLKIVLCHVKLWSNVRLLLCFSNPYVAKALDIFAY